MSIKILSPEMFNKKNIDIFYELVKEGEQVNLNGLKGRILRSALLGFYSIENKLVSVSSIKNPNSEYKERIFKKANISELAVRHQYELGYAYTIKEYRGMGINISLNERLLDQIEDHAVYATTHNENMKSSLVKMGFEAVGREYEGDKGDKIQMYSYDILKNMNDGVSGFINLEDIPD